MRVLCFIVAVLFGCAPIFVQIVAAAEPVRVRAAAHEPQGKDAYGRIVFDWPSAVPYKAAIEGGRLVVRFEQPFTGRLDVVDRALGDYVEGAVVENDGRIVAFPLKGALRLKAYADGGTIVLDLIRGTAPARIRPSLPELAATTLSKTADTAAPKPADTAAPKPADTAAPKPANNTGASPNPAQSVPTLLVRAGDHDGFGRLVFDWTRNVGYTVDHQGNRATIRFDQPARLDYAGLAKRPPKMVTAIEPSASGSGAALTISLGDNARLRHFRSGTRVVIDILEPAAGTRAAATAKASPPSAPPIAPPSPPTNAAPTREKAPAPAAASRPANLLARGAQSGGNAAGKDADGAALDDVLAGIPGMNKVAPVRNELPSSPTGAKPAAAKAAPASAAKPMPAGAAAPANRNAPRDAPAAQPTPPDETARMGVPAASRIVIRAIAKGTDVTALRFSAMNDEPAVIYERHDQLWMFLRRPLTVEVQGTWPRTVDKPHVVATGSKEVLLLNWPLPPGKTTALRREGADWIFDVLSNPRRPDGDIKSDVIAEGENAPTLVIHGPDYVPPHSLRDPDAGDLLWLVPSATPSRSLANERRMVDLHLLPTLQGLVIKPLNDDLMVRKVAQGVEVSMPGGLTMTGTAMARGANPGGPGASTAAAATAAIGSSGNLTAAPLPAGTPIPTLAVQFSKLFDFDAWRAPENTGFYDRRRDLQFAVIEAPKTSRNAARLALARFYFAHGHAADAIGILQVIEADDATATKDPAFRALRGAARFLTNDYAAAGPDLFDSALDTEREAALWRGALLASQNDWIAASRYFAPANGVMQGYPYDLRMRFGLLAAESALNTGDNGLAQFHLEAMKSANPSRAWRDQMDYLQGRILAVANNVTGAADAWQRAMAGSHRPTKVRAQLARTELLLGAKRITPAEAVGDMERLRYAWRGDEIELAVLKRLGELYIDTADFRSGLNTLREAQTYFPKSVDSAAIDAKMRAAFAALFLGDAAAKLPPLAAVALYDEFQDLAPSGEAGDQLASQLVDRLVSVDLLDRAADVLKQQIDKRLSGPAAVEAANRLAVIHLLARQPEEALAVLNGRVPPEASPQLVTQRRQLRARTLGELARYKEALAALEGDDSLDASRLRAEIAWRTQNWPLAGNAFARLLPANGVKLTDADRQTVLRLAIAHTLANNKPGLAALRKSYGAEMEQSAFREAFNLVTAPVEGRAVDLRAITKQIGDVDQFRSFLSGYREKLLPRQTPAEPAPAAKPARPAANQAAATE